MLEFQFNKELQSNFSKKRLQHMCFLMDIAEFLRSPVLILKNICDRVLQSDVIWTRSISSNLAFAQPILLKFLFQNLEI